MARRAKASDISNATRSQVVTIRLDPRLKYLAEIAARKQRRTLSGYIEWAVEQSLSSVILFEDEGDRNTAPTYVSVASAQNIHDLWDVEEADRVIKLALNFPDLLTYEEQLVWKIVRECGHIWRGDHNKEGDWSWRVSDKTIVWDRLRKYWDVFCKVAAKELTKDHLPKTSKLEPPEPAPRPVPDFDDEIPF